jgi:hypothetical protein
VRGPIFRQLRLPGWFISSRPEVTRWDGCPQQCPRQSARQIICAAAHDLVIIATGLVGRIWLDANADSADAFTALQTTGSRRPCQNLTKSSPGCYQTGSARYHQWRQPGLTPACSHGTLEGSWTYAPSWPAL